MTFLILRKNEFIQLTLFSNPCFHLPFKFWTYDFSLNCLELKSHFKVLLVIKRTCCMGFSVLRAFSPFPQPSNCVFSLGTRLWHEQTCTSATYICLTATDPHATSAKHFCLCVSSRHLWYTFAFWCSCCRNRFSSWSWWLLQLRCSTGEHKSTTTWTRLLHKYLWNFRIFRS